MGRKRNAGQKRGGREEEVEKASPIEVLCEMRRRREMRGLVFPGYVYIHNLRNTVGGEKRWAKSG